MNTPAADAHRPDLRPFTKLGLFDWDLKTNRVYWSDDLYRIYGYEPGEIEINYSTFLAHVDPADRPHVEQAIAKTIRGEGPFRHEERILGRNQEERVLESQGHVISDVQGNPQRLVGACIDITDLRHHELLLRSVLSSVTDALFVVDPRGQIVLANPATQRIFHCSATEICGNVERLLCRVSDDDAALSNDRWQSLLQSQLARQANIACTLFRRDGVPFPAEISISSMQVRNELHHVVVARDISERQSLQQQLELSQRLEAIGRLAGGIAHDFNNLLTVIVGSNDLITMQLDSDHPLRDHTEAIRAASQRAANMTRQLLAFSRQQVMHPQILDANDVVQQAEPLLHRVLNPRITLSTRLAKDLAPIRADRGQLEQVILNLVINARDAMPQGGQLTISTRQLAQRSLHSTADTAPKNIIEIVVSDTGVGIADDVLPRIFEPFFTTKEAGKGSGLGLAVAHGIIEQMGGAIIADSSPGQGTHMRLRLPAITPLAD